MAKAGCLRCAPSEVLTAQVLLRCNEIDTSTRTLKCSATPFLPSRPSSRYLCSKPLGNFHYRRFSREHGGALRFFEKRSGLGVGGRSGVSCQAAAEADYAPDYEERARIQPCKQAPSLDELLTGKWLEKEDQEMLLVSERLALGAADLEDELFVPERLTQTEIAEFEADPNVALVLNPKGDLVGTYIGAESAVAWVKSLDRESAVAWFWNRLNDDHYREFMAKDGDWWRGEEWQTRPPHWYEYTRKDGKRVVWGQDRRILSHSIQEFTDDTLERVARFLVFHEEGQGSLASQPEGSVGRYIRDRILESKAAWLADGTISPRVSELEAGDEKWAEFLQRKWKDVQDSFMENKFDAWRQGVKVDDRTGKQYSVPNKFGWKGPVHRTM